MGVRRRGPALIELVRGARMDAPTTLPARTDHPLAPRSAPQAPAPRPAPTPAPAPVAEDQSGWPTAGDSIRVPVGYIFLGVAAIIASFIIAYFIGFSRGEEREKTRLAAAEPPLPSPELDPLNRPLANQPTDTRAADAKNAKPSGGGKTPGGAGGASPANPDRPAPTSTPGDPRTPGLNYFILADRIPEEEAQKAADFLTSHNLAAAVVHSNNAKFRRVIATRGFTGSEVSGPDAQSLRQEAARIGQLYKSQQKGQVDFAKVYPEKHQP